MEAKFETLDENSSKRFYLQYRFPPSSVGEVGRLIVIVSGQTLIPYRHHRHHLIIALHDAPLSSFSLTYSLTGRSNGYGESTRSRSRQSGGASSHAGSAAPGRVPLLHPSRITHH